MRWIASWHCCCNRGSWKRSARVEYSRIASANRRWATNRSARPLASAQASSQADPGPADWAWGPAQPTGPSWRRPAAEAPLVFGFPAADSFFAAVVSPPARLKISAITAATTITAADAAAATIFQVLPALGGGRRFLRPRAMRLLLGPADGRPADAGSQRPRMQVFLGRGTKRRVLDLRVFRPGSRVLVYQVLQPVLCPGRIVRATWATGGGAASGFSRQLSNSAMISAMVCGRSSGRFASIRWIAASSVSGQSGRSSVTDGIGSSRWARIRFRTVSPPYTGRRVSK